MPINKDLLNITKDKRGNNYWDNPLFKKLYLYYSIIILVSTTIYWSILGAKIASFNSDQLSPPHLFNSLNSLSNSSFPGVHSFLIKWPVFWMIRLFNYSGVSFTVFTVALSLITVLGFIFILSRIERRPLVLGTIVLALSSVLLMVPIQSYPGALLPVSMAMITTRNIEYLLFIVGLIAVVKASKIVSWWSVMAVIVLGVLVASDKLFMSMAILGAILGLVYFIARNKWKIVHNFNKFLVIGVASAALGIVVLSAINALGLVHIGSSIGSTYYGIVGSVKNLVLGSFYAVTGLFTNFGAYPGYSATTLSGIPKQFITNFLSGLIVPYVINLFIALLVLYSTFKLFKEVGSNKRKETSFSLNLSLLLVSSAVASIVLFIVSNHYYTVDARYLGIALFAGFTAIVTYYSTRRPLVNTVFTFGLVCFIGVVFGVLGSWHGFQKQQEAYSGVQNRDSSITEALNSHKVEYLVGDYWRVYEASDGIKNTTPLAINGCTNILPISGFTLDALKHHSFAYILTLDKGLSGSSGCSVEQVTKLFGKPNGSLIIAGNYDHPKEFILFYDRGIHKSAPKIASQTYSTIIPINLSEMPNTSCSGPTSMNFVAHEDDDLLFMNPDIQKDIQLGRCVRTVFLTAGDAGSSKLYWISRQEGSQAAYSYMLGLNNATTWTRRIIKLDNGQYITVANPRGNTKLSLIFINLPDGGLKGEGFKGDGYESLEKLYSSKIKNIHSVDGQSNYSLTGLEGGLEKLMNAYRPSLIRLQGNYTQTQYPDHSDHIASGKIVASSYKLYENDQYQNLVTIPLEKYVGYPTHGMPQNIKGDELTNKILTFLKYSSFDGSVCSSIEKCNNTATYGSYLSREYRINN